jgi:hypothetical protein
MKRGPRILLREGRSCPSSSHPQLHLPQVPSILARCPAHAGQAVNTVWLGGLQAGTHREEALPLGRGGLQPAVLGLWVLHLLNAGTQQLILQQGGVGQAICGQRTVSSVSWVCGAVPLLGCVQGMRTGLLTFAVV